MTSESIVEPIIVGILVAAFIVGIVVWLVTLARKKGKWNKWNCVEGRCEADINGVYSSRESCQKECLEKTNLMRALAMAEAEDQAWACNSNYQCVQADQGYTSKALCEQNCNAPVVYYPTYHYYPQSLLPRRPRRWSPRREPGRRGGRRRR